MSSMDGFLGKVVNDAISGARETNRLNDGIKLSGQRLVNIAQQTQINQDKQYIHELQAEIKKLKQKLNQNNQEHSTQVYPRDVAFSLGIIQTDISQADFFIENNISYDPYKTYEQNINDYEINKTKNNLSEGLFDEYENLLSKPMHEIASKNKNFRKTYEEQQTLLADWMVSQKAFKELAIQFGKQLGKTPDQVKEMGLDKEIDVLQDKNDPSHKTNFGDSTHPESIRETLLDKAQKDKVARKAKKGS